MKIKGTVTHWNDAKGYGFVQSDSGQKAFFHIRDLLDQQRPQVGDKVLYFVAKDDQERWYASEIKYDSKSTDNSARVSPSNTKISHAKLLFFGILLVPVLVGLISVGLDRYYALPIALYLFASITVFLLYKSDKNRAGVGARRIPEARLHFFELIGGWPGAMIAQQMFRHKTRKITYQLIFWLIVILHEFFWIDKVFLGGKYFGVA